jgi:endonuclease/exonuclease/phosphatase family metal-dependent hydrolase
MRLVWLVWLLGCSSETTQPATVAPPVITAVTYNMYFGIPTEIVPQNTSAASLAGSINAVINGIGLTDFRCRIDGAAQILANEMVDVIGTQEAILIAYARNLDERDDDVVLVDFPNELADALERHSGLRYQVFIHENTVIQAGLPVLGGVRLIERSAILVHPRLPAHEGEGFTFPTLEPASDFVPTGTGEIVRGALHVQIPFADGETIDVYNTHLQSSGTGSSASEPVRFAQAQELLDFIDRTRRPGSTIVLTGDMNDEPATRTYDVLAADLTDTFANLNSSPGHTAYLDQALTDPNDEASIRIDYVFSNTPQVNESRVILDHMVPACNLWPSDHFGVLSRFNKLASQ